MLHGPTHLRRVAHEEPCPAMFYDLGQSPGRKCDDRRSGSKRLHRHERARFRREARHDEAARRCHQASLSQKPDGAEETAPAVEPWRDLAAKKREVAWIGESLAAEQQWHACASRSIESEVETLLGADAADGKGEAALGVAPLEGAGLDAVSDLGEQARSGRAGAALRFRDTMQKGAWPAWLEDLLRVPGGR